MKSRIKKYFRIWVKELLREARKDWLKSIIYFALAVWMVPILGAHLFSAISWTTGVGYIVYCIYKLPKIINDIRRIVVIFAGYAIGSVVLTLIVNNAWPELKSATLGSFISGAVILFVAFRIWKVSKELKES